MSIFLLRPEKTKYTDNNITMSTYQRPLLLLAKFILARATVGLRNLLRGAQVDNGIL